MKGSRLKTTKIFVCKCQYLGVTFAKILIGIKMVEKQKTKKNCDMCNKTIKITFYCITTKKTAREIKNIINRLQIGQTNPRTNKFHKYVCHA